MKHTEIKKNIRIKKWFRLKWYHDKFVYEFIKTDVEDIRKFRKIIIQQYDLI